MNKVFVYSGTGNTWHSAKMIAESLGAEPTHITDELAHSNQEFTGDVCVVMFPVYGYGMPKTVKRFIKRNRFAFAYLAVIVTQGSKHGGSLAEAIRLFRRRGKRPDFTYGIKAVENFVHMFKLPEEEQIALIDQRQVEQTQIVIGKIAERTRNKRFLFRPESSFVSFLFRRVTRMFARRYRFLDTCSGCSVCYRVCPARAIEMVDQRPKMVAKKCDNCQACLQLCPQHAIKFGRIKPSSRRYRRKGVNVSDLVKRD